MKLNINLANYKVTDMRNVLIGFAVLIALIVLSYVLFHNPHKYLHAQIFSTADRVRNYYRDKPNYWSLSTSSARDNNLIAPELLKYSDYDVQIGEGENGDVALPHNTTFDIVLKHLNKSACINLTELPISKYNQLGLLKITIINNSTTAEYAWDEKNPLPINRYATRDVCQAVENTIIWTFQ